MEKVLIDLFTVPDESKPGFLEAARESARFLRTLPGFVDGFLHEQTDGDSPYTVITTAVWESEAAFDNARRAAAEEFRTRGFNPQETMKRLNVQIKRAVYTRSRY